MKIGRFHVLDTLGTGAHSTILHVRRSADARHYALKVVKIATSSEQKFLNQARHEFDVAKRFDHPNLIKIYALDEHRDWLFRIREIHLLIEYVQGKTLDTLQRLSVPRLVQIFEKVASGLVHMHRRSVYHADLKPNNIMLSRRKGEVKIIDYGLAWIRGTDKDRVQGTPEYMAPEQVTQRVVNEGTDIYNFGATMYRLLTFHLPPNALQAARDSSLVDARTWKQAIKPIQAFNSNAPRELCDLVHQCLSYFPTDRPARAVEIQEALSNLQEELVHGSNDRLETLEL
jgi:serine/threonine protein kinase